MTWFEIGNIVTPKKPVKGLRKGKEYKIINIHRGLDGAYDWDDLFFEGVSGRFCEFDFEFLPTKA